MTISIWTTWVVLSILGVNNLSFAESDTAYSIPRVGTGRRSQYYVQHRDGTYKYGHDTGEGAFESVKLTANGNIDGEFGYTDDEGHTRVYTYTAGSGTGFVIEDSDVFPAVQPPSPTLQPSASLLSSISLSPLREGKHHPTNFQSSTSSTTSGDLIYNAPLPFDPQRHPVEQAVVRNHHTADGGHFLNYKTSTHERTESIDNNNEVTGNFAFVTEDDGLQRTIQYKASADTGFTVEGDHLPIGPEVPGAPSGRPTGRLMAVRQIPFIDPLANPNSDASYNFNYQSKDGARREQSNREGTVTGSYSYVDDEGRTRSYTYTAGKGIGFLIKEDGLAPTDVTAESSIAATRQENQIYTAPEAAASNVQTSITSISPTSISPASSTSSSTANIDHATANVVRSSRGSHILNYKTSTHERTESIDKNNKVTGNFAFVTEDDGVQRAIQHEASADTGFTVEGDHLPIGPEVPGALSGRPTGRLMAVRQIPFIDPLANPNSDASYNFNYQSKDGARREQSNREGTVTGSYSYVDDEGRTRSYTYTAGKGIGFQVKEDGLAPTDVTAESSIAATRQENQIYTAPEAAASNVQTSITSISPTSISPASSTRSSAANIEHATVNVVRSSRGSHILNYKTSTHERTESIDKNNRSSRGSHILNYKTSTHERTESIDKNNKVTGNFAFVTEDDGVQRAIQYEANADTGFTVEGDHLPIGPEVPGAPSGRPTGRLMAVRQIPFIDPLANPNSDASYNFNYQSKDGARREQSNREGTVTGSYSYVDDEGRTRSYTYTAGKGIGFQVKEDGLAPTEMTAEPIIAATRQANQLYTAPEAAASNVQTSITSISPTSISPASSISSSASNINHANAVRSSLRRHILNYKTPTHERKESIGENKRVVGNFAFVADDGIRRSIQYEANADTGFTTDGDHLPVGPIVPGAPSGKPNGKLSSVKTTPFIDPLANSDNDPSYNFAFNSEQYSRSETSDSNGNVQGTYTVVDDDGVSRTHSYRAGEEIGFEVQLTESQIPQSIKESASSQNFKSIGLDTAAYSSRPSAYSASASNQRSSTFLPMQTSSQQNFNLQQYNDPHKFGYVLTFGN